MTIQEKLITDKKKLALDIDVAVEKLDEYSRIIDKLAQQIEIAREALEFYIRTYNAVDYPISDDFAVEALEKIEELDN